MELAGQLSPKLKSLRLSGILETLDLRNKQALEEKCSYVEFLSKLLEDEVERRGQKHLTQRLRRSHLDPGKTLETFDFTFNLTIEKRQVYDLAACGFVERAEAIFLLGPAGVGKTHLAQAFGHEAIRRGYDVLLLSASELLRTLHAGRADGSYERRLASYQQVDVLILDDFGLKPMRPPAPEDLYDVIDGRYGKRPIILTSNRAFEEWPELFENSVLASAALDRLAHGATRLVIEGDSFRAKGPRLQAKEERTKTLGLRTLVWVKTVGFRRGGRRSGSEARTWARKSQGDGVLGRLALEPGRRLQSEEETALAA